ncbi:MAG: hypothetical protein IPN13_09985 [Bacteroidetes bacterium]|nr:hypothetical protein [Bacteroidota bacterium]
MFKYKSILISFLFFQCLIAHGQRVPQIRVPNSTLPDIASTFDLLDIIVESLKMEGTIKLSSTLFSIQSQINQDLSLYGACRPYRIHLFLNGYILSDVYLESSPIEKEFVFGKTKIHYTSKNDLTFIAKQETNILTGIIKISSKDNCNIPKTNLTKYTELCEHANNKFSQVSNILWNLGNQNGVQSLQSEILNQVMTLDSISDSTANLNHELDLCETKKVQLKEKIEKLTEQTLKLNESKSNFSESLKKYEDAIQKTLVKIKNEQKKHREKEEFYNSLCEVNKCNCPERHGTSCHHNVCGGYTCEEWKQQIPCEDDFECQKLKELDLIKQSIKIYKGKKENYNVKIDTLRNRISRVQKKLKRTRKRKNVFR